MLIPNRKDLVLHNCALASNKVDVNIEAKKTTNNSD
jgi:hypothetical protein